MTQQEKLDVYEMTPNQRQEWLDKQIKRSTRIKDRATFLLGFFIGMIFVIGIQLIWYVLKTGQ